MSKIRAAVVTEGELHEVVEFDTDEQMDWYQRGLSTGAAAYGAGGCGLYTLDDLDDLEPAARADVQRALATGKRR